MLARFPNLATLFCRSELRSRFLLAIDTENRVGGISESRRLLTADGYSADN